MANVFLGFQRGIGGFEKMVILKKILPEFANNKVFLEMFVNEAKSAAAIRHPNVVETYEIRHEEGELFIAMEYIDGVTLGELLNYLKGTKIPIGIGVRIIADIVAGLHAAHEETEVQGQKDPIIHLDLTPSNLMVSANGSGKILDYGIAMATSSADSRNFLGGKPGYIPPEYSIDGLVDPRGDIFQIGLVMHEFLTGERLFSGESPTICIAKTEEQTIPSVMSLRLDVPDELDELIAQCLERDPKDRVQTAAELKKRLGAFLKTQGNPGRDDVSHWLSEHCAPLLARKKKVEREVRKTAAAQESKRGFGQNQGKESIGSLILKRTSEGKKTVVQPSFTAQTKVENGANGRPVTAQTHVAPTSSLPVYKRKWFAMATILTFGFVLGIGINKTLGFANNNVSVKDKTTTSNQNKVEEQKPHQESKRPKSLNLKTIADKDSIFELGNKRTTEATAKEVIKEPAVTARKKSNIKKQARKNDKRAHRDRVKERKKQSGSSSKSSDLHDPWQAQ